MIEKNEKDIDCRALSLAFFSDFMLGKKYHVFVELVNKYRDELVLCFRGNNKPTEAVCIYYNNHLVYKIESNGIITINFNHARYSPNYREYWKLINHTYGYNKSAIDNPRISVTEKKSTNGKISYYTGIGYISTQFNDDIHDNIENIYVNCIRKMLIDSFDVSYQTDQFRATANKYAAYKGKLSQTGNKSLWLEKVRQQQLFSRIKYQKEGYFLYDLEFSQKKMDDLEDQAECLSNEPDMLAVYFDSTGNPDRFAFVEVKSTDKAYSGDSGMVAHLKKMRKYPVEYLEARLREAALIIQQYKELGLYNISREVLKEEFSKLAKKNYESLFIFTDKAVGRFHNDASVEIVKFREKAKKINNIDIYIPGCKELEFWVI